jgi:hypothetical protein
VRDEPCGENLVSKSLVVRRLYGLDRTHVFLLPNVHRNASPCHATIGIDTIHARRGGRPVVRSARSISRSLLAFAFVAAACTGMLTGCSQPPAISKVELDAAKLPKKHPKLTPKQVASGCRSCHREQPPIKKK